MYYCSLKRSSSHVWWKGSIQIFCHPNRFSRTKINCRCVLHIRYPSEIEYFFSTSKHLVPSIRRRLTFAAHLGKSSLDKNNIPVRLFCGRDKKIIIYIKRVYMYSSSDCACARRRSAYTGYSPDCISTLITFFFSFLFPFFGRPPKRLNSWDIARAFASINQRPPPDQRAQQQSGENQL